MTDLEDSARSALQSLPEPDMQLPHAFAVELRRKHQRRRLYAPTALASLGVLVAITAVSWHPHAGSPSPAIPAISTTPDLSSSPSPALIQTQRILAATLPPWGNDAGAPLQAWVSSPQAFTVAGSPVFVVGESVPGPAEQNDPTVSKKPEAQVEIQRTQVLQSPILPRPQAPSGVLPTTSDSESGVEPALRAQRALPSVSGPANSCGLGGSSGGGTSLESDFGLTSPALMQLRCWPTLQENVWVWSRLPSNVATIAYVMDGRTLARSSTVNGVGAIRIPRPASADADQGQLEGLSTTDDVILHSPLPWMD
jgi:hypothetical protein